MKRNKEIKEEIHRIDGQFPFPEPPQSSYVGEDYFAEAREKIMGEVTKEVDKSQGARIINWKWWMGAAAAIAILIIFLQRPAQEENVWSEFNDAEWELLTDMVLNEPDVSTTELSSLLEEGAFAELQWDAELQEDDIELWLDVISKDVEMNYLTDQIELQ